MDTLKLQVAVGEGHGKDREASITELRSEVEQERKALLEQVSGSDMACE